ncbi:YhgE/Pip domain-containing protein [Alkalibacillus silvisoli]|uniref:YhgE/Pip domain-containing protein n=1 Tax=Alkalibacillus silvisoli TaxID=392823 RepID=A0ABN0ZNE5_9BACI
MKRLLFIVIASLLLIPSFAIATSGESESDEPSSTQGEGSYSEKHEVIYATLDAGGEQDAMYVVNQFNVTESGEMVDFGPYESVQNLTNLEEMSLNSDEVTFSATEDQFYYQGNLNGMPLPWTFDVGYTLDGEEVDANDILGEDGQLQIEIETNANDDVDPVFYDNYLLQISLTLDSEIYNQIEAEDGTIASAGKNKQVTFTVMPGEDEHFIVEANVSDFEFDGVEISALPASMSVDQPETGEMKDEMSSLSDGIAEVHDGVGDLQDGVSEMNDGIIELHDGSFEYLDGMRELDDGSSDLIEGSLAIDDALRQMSAGFDADHEMDFSEIEELSQGLKEIADGLYEIEGGLSELRGNYQEALEALDNAIEAIPSGELDEEDIEGVYASGADRDVVDQLVETYEAALQAKGTYDAVSEAFNVVDPVLSELEHSIHDIASNLDMIADELAGSIDDMDFIDDLAQLQEGLNEISSQYGEFHAGLIEYTDGVGELSESYSDIHDGIGELSEGTAELEDGVHELHDGTGELAEETSNLPDQMQEEIDEMMNDFDHSDFDPVSFVSERNEAIETVQFVIQTESITMEDDDDEEIVEEEDKGIWERFLDLFR